MIKRVLCFENPARLSFKLAQMVVELQDVTRTLPIEEKVLEMWSKGGVTSDISSEQKRILLGITTMDVNISGHRSPMMLTIQTTAQSVQKCFSGEARKIIYPDW